MKKKTKKRGRPALPEQHVKKRANLRLSDTQTDIIYTDLDRALGLQEAVDKMIFQYSVYLNKYGTLDA